MPLTRFQYSKNLVEDFPNLCVNVLIVDSITKKADVAVAMKENYSIARSHLKNGETEGQLRPIQAWRTAYRAVGTDPTKYRMAAESILRRMRIGGDMPRLHPLVMLCNSISARFALPVAAMDIDRVEGELTVTYSDGTEIYDGFDGKQISLQQNEVTFKDTANRAHSRKWSHKQSAHSCITDVTKRVIIMSEALHIQADDELAVLSQVLAKNIASVWPNSKIRQFEMRGDDLVVGIER